MSGPATQTGEHRNPHFGAAGRCLCTCRECADYGCVCPDCTCRVVRRDA